MSSKALVKRSVPTTDVPVDVSCSSECGNGCEGEDSLVTHWCSSCQPESDVLVLRFRAYPHASNEAACSARLSSSNAETDARAKTPWQHTGAHLARKLCVAFV